MQKKLLSNDLNEVISSKEGVSSSESKSSKEFSGLQEELEFNIEDIDDPSSSSSSSDIDNITLNALESEHSVLTPKPMKSMKLDSIKKKVPPKKKEYSSRTVDKTAKRFIT